MNYEEEFKIFSSNVNIAARSFYYHKEIQNQVFEDCKKYEYPQYSPLFQAIDANAQFWNDYKLQSILETIITLGRIFDKKKKSHGVKRLVKEIKDSGSFTKENLRKRKISESNNAESYIDAFMDNVSEFNINDYHSFLRYVVNTRKIYKVSVKGVRNKFYAHQDKLDIKQKEKILGKAQYGIIDDLISRLLTIEHILFDAYYNGKKPDLTYKNESVYRRVKDDVSKLLLRLSPDYK